MNPSVPTGTRDFGPEQVLKRNFIFDTIKRVFVKYGYQPIETPTMENLSTLTGKYGEEGDKLLYKVLNSGDYLAKADVQALENRDSAKLANSISKRGLRYDLTVPFARFVVMNRGKVAFPFKRYQIQPVWRADRPQKGRYREFYQCDVDVVGSNSLVYEAELIQIYDEVFADLGIEVIIKLNNRKVLAGIAEVAGIGDKMADMTVAIDKLDKIGLNGVIEQMSNRNIPDSAIKKIIPFFGALKNVKGLEDLKDLQKSNFRSWVPKELKLMLATSEIGLKGVEEIEQLAEYLRGVGSKNKVQFDITLARGLSYYTGCIFEVAVDTSVESQKDVIMGSIGGGGRYDDLTGIFGMKNVSGVGVSFGAARIFDVMEELALFPKENQADLKALFIAFDAATHVYAFNALTQLRQAGINADIYPDPVKMKKQLKYANDRKVPYVVLVGSQEMESRKFILKYMDTGQQEKLNINQLISRLQSKEYLNQSEKEGRYKNFMFYKKRKERLEHHKLSSYIWTDSIYMKTHRRSN